MLESDEHPEKIPALIDFIDVGKDISVIEVHSEKAYFLIDLTERGMVICLIDWHFSKAFSPITVVAKLIFTDNLLSVSYN